MPLASSRIFEAYVSLGFMTSEEVQSANSIKNKILRYVRDYFRMSEMAKFDLEYYRNLKQEEESREVDPYDYDAPEKDVASIEKKIDQAEQFLEEDDGKVRVHFPASDSVWSGVKVKPRVIKEVSRWMANDVRLNGRWVSNELVVVDTTRMPRQRSLPKRA